MDSSGIYKITCLDNGKVYVGSAIWIKKRWSSHKVCLKRNTHHNPHLQSAFNKYGKESFIYEVLEECSKNKLIEREQYWMGRYKAVDKTIGFNIVPYADRKEMSEETKLKISLANKGRKRSKQTRAKMRYAQQNRSKEWKRNIAKSKLGKHLSKKHKEACSLAAIKRWDREGRNPKPLKLGSEELRKKRSESHMGQISVNSKKCICVETGEIFDSIRSAARTYNPYDSAIGYAIRNGGKSCKKTWQYYKEE